MADRLTLLKRAREREKLVRLFPANLSSVGGAGGGGDPTTVWQWEDETNITWEDESTIQTE